MTRLEELSALGQSVWIDFLSRDLIESGGLARAIDEDAVVGVTSNPSIFGKALSRGSAYDAQIESSVGELISVFHALAMRDVAAACDVLRPVWERTESPRRLRVNRGRSEPSRPTRTARSLRQHISTRRSPVRTCW